MKYTAQMILEELRNNHPKVLALFEVNAKDRKESNLGKKSFKCFIIQQKSISSKVGFISIITPFVQAYAFAVRL
jgi:hypothetical protein